MYLRYNILLKTFSYDKISMEIKLGMLCLEIKKYFEVYKRKLMIRGMRKGRPYVSTGKIAKKRSDYEYG